MTDRLHVEEDRRKDEARVRLERAFEDAGVGRTSRFEQRDQEVIIHD